MSNFRRAALSLSVTLTCFLVPVSATADSPTSRTCDPGTEDCTRALPALPGGQVAIIDPDTGQLIQAPDAPSMSDDMRVELETFNQLLQETFEGQFSVEGLQEVRTESGAVGVDLGDRFLVPYVVHIDETGKQHFGHGSIAVD